MWTWTLTGTSLILWTLNSALHLLMAKQTTLFVGQNRFDCKMKEYSLYVDGALCMYISVYCCHYITRSQRLMRDLVRTI